MVKESKINQKLRDYKLFKMEKGESISSMNSRFTNITNELKRLDKGFTKEEMVKKILISLTKSSKIKKIAIEEVHDLSELSYDEIMGSFITHEISLQTHGVKKTTRSKKKEKTALLGKSLEENSEHEEMTNLIQLFKKMMSDEETSEGTTSRRKKSKKDCFKKEFQNKMKSTFIWSDEEKDLEPGDS